MHLTNLTDNSSLNMAVRSRANVVLTCRKKYRDKHGRIVNYGLTDKEGGLFILSRNGVLNLIKASEKHKSNGWYITNLQVDTLNRIIDKEIKEEKSPVSVPAPVSVRETVMTSKTTPVMSNDLDITYGKLVSNLLAKGIICDMSQCSIEKPESLFCISNVDQNALKKMYRFCNKNEQNCSIGYIGFMYADREMPGYKKCFAYFKTLRRYAICVYKENDIKAKKRAVKFVYDFCDDIYNKYFRGNGAYLKKELSTNCGWYPRKDLFDIMYNDAMKLMDKKLQNKPYKDELEEAYGSALNVMEATGVDDNDLIDYINKRMKHNKTAEQSGKSGVDALKELFDKINERMRQMNEGKDSLDRFWLDRFGYVPTNLFKGAPHSDSSSSDSLSSNSLSSKTPSLEDKQYIVLGIREYGENRFYLVRDNEAVKHNLSLKPEHEHEHEYPTEYWCLGTPENSKFNKEALTDIGYIKLLNINHDDVGFDLCDTTSVPDINTEAERFNLERKIAKCLQEVIITNDGLNISEFEADTLTEFLSNNYINVPEELELAELALNNRGHYLSDNVRYHEICDVIEDYLTNLMDDNVVVYGALVGCGYDTVSKFYTGYHVGNEAEEKKAKGMVIDYFKSWADDISYNEDIPDDTPEEQIKDYIGSHFKLNNAEFAEEVYKETGIKLSGAFIM